MTNTTYQLAPWADTLFAMDRAWWNVHLSSVRKVFTGDLVTTGVVPRSWGVYRLAREKMHGFGNSGAAAVELAVVCGAKRVIMLGYDLQKTGGKVHWHGDHPRTLGNAGAMPRWPRQFAQLEQRTRGHAEVINASRATALKVYPTMALEEALAL